MFIHLDQELQVDIFTGKRSLVVLFDSASGFKIDALGRITRGTTRLFLPLLLIQIFIIFNESIKALF